MLFSSRILPMALLTKTSRVNAWGTVFSGRIPPLAITQPESQSIPSEGIYMVRERPQPKVSANSSLIFNRFTRNTAVVLAAAALSVSAVFADTALTLSDSAVRLTWEKSSAGWAVHEVAALASGMNSPPSMGRPSGLYTVVFSPTLPAPNPIGPPLSEFYEPSAESSDGWARHVDAVSLNVAGQALTFLPAKATKRSDGSLEFEHTDDTASVQAQWSLDPNFPGDVRVRLTLTAKRAGYYSIATPTLATVPVEDLRWATVPGYFQSSTIEKNLLLSYGYGQGLPNRPVVLRERTASTLASIMTHRSGATLAVVAEPGTASDPWAKDRDTRAIWKLGLSHMNRDGELAPTLYHPVLGQEGSHLAAGESRTFRFRYTVRTADWFAVYKHVVADIYQFGEALALREPQRSLSDRIHALHRYVVDDQASLWHVENSNNLLIGAQRYLGVVTGARERGDSMKNSDYGAMWMLARITGDPKLILERLPYARNFKFSQIQAEPGFFQGAAVGQYYLPSSKRFIEERGDYVEPVALTYYALIDLGNILLFSPEDTELRTRFRLSAERLLSWQHSDGHWEVGYSRKTEQPVFTDLTDYRPTFYGLLVAYRVLGDKKYLVAARRGADWLVQRGVEQGKFLGVCGDGRFVPDFATAQISQALLDLYATTGDRKYRDAGIAAARFYTSSVYTHPVASHEPRIVHPFSFDNPRADDKVLRREWEISQAGLSFEHGGLMGSANVYGPILLASHAGLFLRIYQLTGEALFRDMARSAAVAREAFVDPATSVASYYWKNMHAGNSRHPQHAWWQIGWITDYLMSEITVRSQDRVTFPRGFFTPKVGPHVTYGFAPGTVYGETAELSWGDCGVDNPAIDCVVAQSTKGSRVFLLLLNEVGKEKKVVLTPDVYSLTGGKGVAWSSAEIVGAARPIALNPAASLKLTLPGYGLTVVALNF
jgi:hypothetical protein